MWLSGLQKITRICSFISVGVCLEVTHVSRVQPEVEGAAVLLALLNGLNSDCWETLPHHQPARHSNALKQQQQQVSQ